jgi:hypothetical protein
LNNPHIHVQVDSCDGGRVSKYVALVKHEEFHIP